MQIITTAIEAQYAQYEFEMAHNKALHHFTGIALKQATLENYDLDDLIGDIVYEWEEKNGNLDEIAEGFEEFEFSSPLLASSFALVWQGVNGILYMSYIDIDR